METQDPAARAQRMVLQCIDWAMEKEFLFAKALGVATSATKEEFYGFRACDVAELHRHKQGYGKAVFFRLKDERVFDGAAQPHEPDKLLYDATTH
jgi:hypothetical protein